MTRKTAVFIFPLIFLFLGHLQKSPVNGVVVAAVIGKDIYFHLMLTSHLLLTALTPLLKGLIILYNSHLTSHKPILTALRPEAAAVFSLHTGRQGSRSAQS